MSRSMLLIVSISIWTLVQSAPSPYYTRSFVQTPTSRVEQYLIVPDKNNPYRVPLSHVHHYSDFQFPRQQLVYYHPDGQQQYSLHEMKKDHPVMQQMMKDLKISEEAMTEEMMMTSTDSNMMEKLKRDDGVISKMMDALKDVSTTTTETSEIFNEAIVVSDENEIQPQMNIELVKMMLKNVKNSEEILRNPDVMEMMKQILENNEKTEEITTTTTIHPLMTEVIVTSPPKIQTADVLMEMLRKNQISEDKITRIAELLENVEQVRIDNNSNEEKIEITTDRMAKVLNLEIVEETKNDSEIQLRLVEENSQTEATLAVTTQRSTTITESEISTQPTQSNFIGSTTEQPRTENDETRSSTEFSIQQESSTERNTPRMSRIELIRSMLRSVGVLEQNLSLMQKINDLNAELEDEISEEKLENETSGVSSTENLRNEMAEVAKTMIMTEAAVESTESAAVSETSTTQSNESIADNTTKLEESINTSSRSDILEIENLEQNLTVQPITESTTAQAIILEQSTEINLSLLSAELPLTEENSTEDSNERNESESSSDETTSIAPQRFNTRQGRVNDAPTVFLHNNRFYVVSGAPEFYANFDAYQNPRTPIFSLQELQPIRPIDRNTPVQRIEPFRIFVEDNAEERSLSSSESNDMENTQNDNDRENEPLKLQSSSDSAKVRSIEERIIKKNIEQRRERQEQGKSEKQEQDQQRAGEAVGRDLSEESSVAQANPIGTAIAGKGGVASSRPMGTALTGDRGLSVASPQATAIAGLFDLTDDDEDRKKLKLRRLRRVRKQ